MPSLCLILRSGTEGVCILQRQTGHICQLLPLIFDKMPLPGTSRGEGFRNRCLQPIPNPLISFVAKHSLAPCSSLMHEYRLQGCG